MGPVTQVSRVRFGLRVRNRVKFKLLVWLTLRFHRIRENNNLGRVQVSSLAGLIQSVMSADTLGNIHKFLMIEGMNQETV
jgi:hypothetical protein